MLGRMATSAGGRRAHALLASGFGFDRIYEQILVHPFVASARANAADFLDGIYRTVVGVCRGFARVLRLSQNGRLRWYAAVAGLGAIIAIYLVVYS